MVKVYFYEPAEVTLFSNIIKGSKVKEIKGCHT